MTEQRDGQDITEVYEDEAGPAVPIVNTYPWTADTAFQDLFRHGLPDPQNPEPRVDEQDNAVEASTDHPDAVQAPSRRSVPESLVQGSEIIGIEVVRQPVHEGIEAVYSDQPAVSVTDAGLGIAGQPYSCSATPRSTQFTEDFEDWRPEDDEVISPISRTSYSLRRLLSRRSSSGYAPSRRGSLHSSLSTRSSRSSRWGSFRERRRERDLEQGPIELDPGSLRFELDSINPKLGPFELCALTREEQRKLLLESRPSDPPSPRAPSNQLGLIESLFGRDLCSPQYVGLRRVYMKQIDAKLTSALQDACIANPNGSVWANPFSFLVSHLAVVSRDLHPNSSVSTFVLSHLDEFSSMIRSGNIVPPPPSPAAEKSPVPDAQGVFTEWYNKVVHEWMLFGLEAWFLLDFSNVIDNRHEILASETFCDSWLGDLIQSHLPSQITHVHASSWTPYSSPIMLSPAEMTASMLHEWKGIRFTWTRNLSEHLRLDSQTMVVTLYEQVAYCHLHAIAGDASALKKAGFLSYHQTLVEVADTFRLLFGADRQSQALFKALGLEQTSGGWFDLFGRLPPSDADPRFLYNVSNDFPVFGERLLVLKSLLKPTGLRGLWKDRRDSLQFYTLWAVLIFGIFSLVTSLLQVGLGAIQAYASMKALAPSAAA